MIRTQIYLPKSYAIKLKKKALGEQITLSAVIRKLLAQNLEAEWWQRQQRNAPARPTLFTALKKVKKLKEMGASDLAQNADFYLYGRKRKGLR